MVAQPLRSARDLPRLGTGSCETPSTTGGGARGDDAVLGREGRLQRLNAAAEDRRVRDARDAPALVRAGQTGSNGGWRPASGQRRDWAIAERGVPDGRPERPTGRRGFRGAPAALGNASGALPPGRRGTRSETRWSAASARQSTRSKRRSRHPLPRRARVATGSAARTARATACCCSGSARRDSMPPTTGWPLAPRRGCRSWTSAASPPPARRVTRGSAACGT
jgi:hypothetical protein